LFVKMNGFATHRHDLDFPRDALSPRPVRIQLEPGATIQVNVVDQDGQAVGFEAVRLFRQLEPIAMLRTDERGVAAFEHLSKDEYHIVLPGRPRAGVRREEVTDALGAKRYRVTIPVRVE
jgi:hypothetical protein